MLPRARFLAARPSSTAACGLLVNTARASRASCNLLPPSNLRLLLPRRSCSTKPGAKTDPFKGFSKDPTPSELPSDQTIAKRLEAGSDVPWTFALYGGVVGSLFSCSIALWNTQPATWFEILIPIPAFAICGYALGLAGLAHAKETPASKKLREQAEKKGASEPGGAFQMVGDKKLKEQAAKQEVGHVFHRIKTFLYKNRVAGFVAGAFFRTPVISAFKLMGTKMVLAGGSSGLLAMVGSVIVFACSVVEFDSSYFESDDGVRPALPLEPSPLPNNNLRTLAEAEIPLPAWWTMQKRSDVSCHLVDVTSDRNLKRAIERGLPLPPMLCVRAVMAPPAFEMRRLSASTVSRIGLYGSSIGTVRMRCSIIIRRMVYDCSRWIRPRKRLFCRGTTATAAYLPLLVVS